MDIRKYSDLRVYEATPHVYIEPVSLKEIHLYTKWLYEAWEKQDIRNVRKYSFQILMWLCHGTRIPDCQFALRNIRHADAMGHYFGTDKKIMLYLQSHIRSNGEWYPFTEYINTLIHEWMHHYSLCVYGRIGADRSGKHDAIFYKRVHNVLARVKKEVKPLLQNSLKVAKSIKA